MVLLLGYFGFGEEVIFIDWCFQLLIDFSFDAFTYEYYNATITIIIIITILIKLNFTFCILICQYFVCFEKRLFLCFLFFIFGFIAMQIFLYKSILYFGFLLNSSLKWICHKLWLFTTCLPFYRFKAYCFYGLFHFVFMNIQQIISIDKL